MRTCEACGVKIPLGQRRVRQADSRLFCHACSRGRAGGGGVMANLHKHAHDSGDGARVYHCAFCGSGGVVGRSDGAIECQYCHSTFTVQVQPEQPFMPQTDPATGEPMDMPGMPGQRSDSGDPTLDPSLDPNADPNADPAQGGEPGKQAFVFPEDITPEEVAEFVQNLGNGMSPEEALQDAAQLPGGVDPADVATDGSEVPQDASEEEADTPPEDPENPDENLPDFLKKKKQSARHIPARGVHTHSPDKVAFLASLTSDPYRTRTAEKIYTDARSVGTILRRAGFSAARAEGSRIRGAANVTDGYVAERYSPLAEWATPGEPRTQIKVSWRSNWARSTTADLKAEASVKIDGMEAALRGAGYEVRREDLTLYVWAPQRTANAGVGPGRTDTMRKWRSGNEAVERMMQGQAQGNGGFSLNRHDRAPSNGFMVATPNNEEVLDHWSQVTPEFISQYMDRHAQEYDQPGRSIGGWIDQSSGKTYLDISQQVPTEQEARSLGQQYNQLAVWDVGKGAEIRLDDQQAQQQPETQQPAQQPQQQQQKQDQYAMARRREARVHPRYYEDF